MIESMRQALEALEMLLNLDTHDEMHLLETDIAPKAIVALKQAIEQVEKPVAWMNAKEDMTYLNRYEKDDIPLYTAPPKHEWVGLTDDDIESIIYGMIECEESGVTGIARLVEKVLKEKNHG